jgi:hypothetical protein
MPARLPTPQRLAGGDFLLGAPHRLAIAMKAGSPIVANQFEPLLADDDRFAAAETMARRPIDDLVLDPAID